MSNVPAGWYPNPDDRTQVRYWDGIQWTSSTASADALVTEAITEPVTAVPAPIRQPQTPAPSLMPAAVPPPYVAQPPAAAAHSSAAPKKKWLIGGAIAAGVIVVGSVGAALGAGGRTATDADAQLPVAATPTAVETSEAPAPTPTSSPTPMQTEPAQVVEVADPIAFKAQAGSHLDDMQKDLGDIVTTVNEKGFWRLLSNEFELAFNLGQLQALDVPSGVATTWPDSLAALEGTVDALSDAITTQDGPTILAAVETVRAQVEATRGVAGTAQ